MGTALDDVKKVINKGDALVKKRGLLEAQIKDIHNKLMKLGPRDKSFAGLVAALEKHTAELEKVCMQYAKDVQALAKKARLVGS